MTSSAMATRMPGKLWRRRFLCGLCIIVMAASLASGCHDALRQLAEASRLAADLRVQFNKASDASIRAVMADTDESSIAFAREAEQASQAVMRDAAALAPLFRDLSYAKEGRLLEEFGRHFAEYQALDRNILELAVENTNLKVQKLSFGPAREAADTFRASLFALARAASPTSRCRVESLVASAVLAVRELQVLHAPHIAESDDAAMTKMEQEMSSRLASIDEMLSTLSTLVESQSHEKLTSAREALDRFKHVHAQIITLSRRNSNVQSLRLALGPGRTLTAACDASIASLQEALAKEGVNATR